MAIATLIDELDVVETTHELDGGIPAGAIGTIVSAHADKDVYLVEFSDGRGRTVALVDAHSADLRVRMRPS